MSKNQPPNQKMGRRLNRHFSKRCIDGQAHEKMLNPIIREIQVKTTMRYHFTWLRMVIIKQSINNAGESVQKKEPSYTVGRDVNWYNYCGQQYGGSSKNLKQNYHTVQQPHILALSGENCNSKNTCIQCSFQHYFTISRRWKNPKCPSTVEWIEKMWYIYTLECYSAIKRMK